MQAYTNSLAPPRACDHFTFREFPLHSRLAILCHRNARCSNLRQICVRASCARMKQPQGTASAHACSSPRAATVGSDGGLEQACAELASGQFTGGMLETLLCDVIWRLWRPVRLQASKPRLPSWTPESSGRIPLDACAIFSRDGHHPHHCEPARLLAGMVCAAAGGRPAVGLRASLRTVAGGTGHRPLPGRLKPTSFL